MTCVVGLVSHGKVWVGADSAGVSGWHITERADAKVFQNGPAVFGFTSSFRMGQLLQYSLKVPEPVGEDIFRYMATEFIDAVRACLKAGGYSTTKDSAEAGGTFLVGIRGHLFTIMDDYQVAQSADEYDAVGCGYDIALGSLYTTREWEDSNARVETALRASERHSNGVRGPFVVRSA